MRSYQVSRKTSPGPHRPDWLAVVRGAPLTRASSLMAMTAELNRAIDTSFIGVVVFRRRLEVNVQVDEVQMVPDGFGFHLQASEYTWVTLVFDTKDEAKAAHSHAAKAVANAKALKIVNR